MRQVFALMYETLDCNKVNSSDVLADHISSAVYRSDTFLRGDVSDGCFTYTLPALLKLPVPHSWWRGSNTSDMTQTLNSFILP